MSDERPAYVPVPTRFLRYVTNLATTEHKGAYPDLKRRAWHLNGDIQCVSVLENAATSIASELRAALQSTRSSDGTTEVRGDVIPLFERGRRHERWCSMLPSTVAVLGNAGFVRTQSGSSFFQRIRPHERVTVPSSAIAATLRCHLGIRVPEHCGIKVGGTLGRWTAGKCLVFDDSFSHTMSNDGDSELVILVADVWHPGLSAEEVQLLSGFEQYVASEAARLQQYIAFDSASRALGANNLNGRLQRSRGLLVPSLFPE